MKTRLPMRGASVIRETLIVSVICASVYGVPGMGAVRFAQLVRGRFRKCPVFIRESEVAQFAPRVGQLGAVRRKIEVD